MENSDQAAYDMNNMVNVLADGVRGLLCSSGRPAPKYKSVYKYLQRLAALLARSILRIEEAKGNPEGSNPFIQGIIMYTNNVKPILPEVVVFYRMHFTAKER